MGKVVGEAVLEGGCVFAHAQGVVLAGRAMWWSDSSTFCSVRHHSALMVYVAACRTQVGSGRWSMRRTRGPTSSSFMLL